MSWPWREEVSCPSKVESQRPRYYLWQTRLSHCQDFNYDCYQGSGETVTFTFNLSFILESTQTSQLAWCISQSRASFKFLSLFDQKPRQVKERWVDVICFAVVILHCICSLCQAHVTLLCFFLVQEFLSQQKIVKRSQQKVIR